MNSLMILVMIFAAFGIYGAVSERSAAARRREGPKADVAGPPVHRVPGPKRARGG